MTRNRGFGVSNISLKENVHPIVPAVRQYIESGASRDALIRLQASVVSIPWKMTQCSDYIAEEATEVRVMYAT